MSCQDGSEIVEAVQIDTVQIDTVQTDTVHASGKVDEFNPRIVDAARQLLASDAGLEFTIDQLAAVLGMSRATLYRRIGSRESLMQHLAKTDCAVAASLSRPDMQMTILLAVRRCFARGGLGHVTMEEIAGEAGVGVATVYRYFGDRQSLLHAFAEEFTPQRAIREIVVQSSGDLASDVQRIVASLLSFIHENWDLLKLSLDDPPGTTTLFSDWRGTRERTVHRLAVYFQEQIDNGTLKDGNVQDWTLTLLGMILAFSVFDQTSVDDRSTDSSEQIARRITPIFLQSIGYDNGGMYR
jgi:AcrR family transcriptional regulator